MSVPDEEKPLAATELRDLAVVNRLPWWMLIAGAAFAFFLTWLLRGDWWFKWVMVAIAAIGVFLAGFAWLRRRRNHISAQRFRARMLPGATLTIIGLTCFLVGMAFPSAMVFIDNASSTDVRLFLDDSEWLTIRNGESAKKRLGKGTYRLTVKSAQGNDILDVHEITVSGNGPYVLNVLGAQVYFHGTARYGPGQPPPMEIITAKWFPLPSVTCLFSDPPDKMEVIHRSKTGAPKLRDS